MTTSTALTPQHGPVPLSQVWSGPKVLAEDLVGEDLADVLDLHSGANAWWVLDRESDYARGELDRLAAALRLDQLAVKDLTATDFRIKFEETSQARLVTTNAVSLNPETLELTSSPVSVLITERALVCLIDPDAPIEPARLLAGEHDRVVAHGLNGALWLLLGSIVATYADALDALEAATDELSEVLFSERAMNKAEQLRGFRLRRSLSRLRRTTEPMRSVLADLSDSLPVPGANGKSRAPRGNTEEIARHWRLLGEKHERVANGADALRESLSVVFDTSLALADFQLNTIMKKLTGWAAIVAVPTLVTGFVGMNVAFPLQQTALGFWLYLVIMVAAALVLWIAFRRRNWI